MLCRVCRLPLSVSRDCIRSFVLLSNGECAGVQSNFGVRRGRHKACPYGDLAGLAGRGLAKLLRSDTCYRYRHQVGEACCRRGGVAGAEPPHKGGPNRPDRPTAGDRGWGPGVRVGGFPASVLIADWPWSSWCKRHTRVRPYGQQRAEHVMRGRAVVVLPGRQGVLHPTTTIPQGSSEDCGSFQRGALVLMLFIPVNSKRLEHPRER